MTKKHRSFNRLDLITDSELDELEHFLISDATPDETMPIDLLDGYFTALIVGPVTPSPSLWLPLVWDMSGGGAEPEFESPEEAQHIIELLMKMKKSIVTQLSDSSDYFELLPDITGLEDGEVKDLLIRLWATGFMIGARCSGVDWSPLLSDKNSLFLLTLINTLSIRPDDPVPLPTKEIRDIWRNMDYCVMEINKFWLSYRTQEQARAKGMALATEAERIGRNDPCPCGSGKKFKKCCGN